MSRQLSLTSSGGLTTSRTAPTSTSSGRPPHPFETVSRERWVEAVRRLRLGHKYRGQGVDPAVRNLTGCLVAQKAGNKADGQGYIQIECPKLTAAHSCEPPLAWQLAHRILCFLEKSTEDVETLLTKPGMEASHRCHLKKCQEVDHLEIEHHDDNMSRRQCEGRVDVVFNIGDRNFLARCPLLCPHTPPCINQREYREVVEVKHQHRVESEEIAYQAERKQQQHEEKKQPQREKKQRFEIEIELD